MDILKTTALPLELNGSPTTANIKFAEQKDFGFLTEWREKLGDDPNPFRVETVDLASLAITRHSEQSGMVPYARSIGDIGDHIVHNPKSEVACFLLLKCDWFRDSSVIGLIHFRRTWCNSIVLDYLSVHPFIAKPLDKYPYVVKGTGLALIYFLSRVAEKYACDYIWGEATQISSGYYKRYLSLGPTEDLILVPRKRFVEFAEWLDLRWQGKTEIMKVSDVKLEDVRPQIKLQDVKLEDLYKLEEDNPPLVGNKFTVFNPPRQLVYHFLELAKHEQLEIAGALGLLSAEDEGLQNDDLFRNIFRRARQLGKLAELWDEVEKKHPQGETDKNPFVKS